MMPSVGDCIALFLDSKDGYTSWLMAYHQRAMFQSIHEVVGIQGENMKTTMLPEHPDAKSPAGADIRFIMDGETGNMIHSTVPPHQVNKATVHATVSEFWYVLEGHGEIWRDDGVESCISVLVPGTSRIVAMSFCEPRS